VITLTVNKDDWIQNFAWRALFYRHTKRTDTYGLVLLSIGVAVLAPLNQFTEIMFSKEQCNHTVSSLNVTISLVKMLSTSLAEFSPEKPYPLTKSIHHAQAETTAEHALGFLSSAFENFVFPNTP